MAFRRLSVLRPRLISLLIALLALGMMAGPALADSHLPSTNDANRANQWAHVNQLSQEIGQTDLEFVSTRNFASCFEYRTDGDTSQQTGAPNFNPDVDDGLYPFVCVNNSTVELTIFADEYVEVRMVFGAESDERFDWTRFEVLHDAQSAEDCKNGGWEAYGFRNQGRCMQHVNTGKDIR